MYYRLWYHHTYRWPSRAQMERRLDGMPYCYCYLLLFYFVLSCFSVPLSYILFFLGLFVVLTLAMFSVSTKSCLISI